MTKFVLKKCNSLKKDNELIRKNKNSSLDKINGKKYYSELLVFVAAAKTEPIDHSWWSLDGNAACQRFSPALFLATEVLAQILALDNHRVRRVVRAHRIIINILIGPTSAAEHQEKRNRNTLFVTFLCINFQQLFC
jgi:hypothetical protein